eukprot:613782-Alexandrium_andersonii.AAC.1
MQILGLAARTTARIAAQIRVAIARRVGGAEPLSRPNARAAKGWLPYGAAQVRVGGRPNPRAAQVALIPGLVARSPARDAHEARSGQLGDGVLQ